MIKISFAGEDNQIRNLLVLDPGGHKAKVNKIIFTGDEKSLVTCSDDKTIKVWDIETGENTRTFRGYTAEGYTGMVYSIALSPDNRLLASGGWFEKDYVRIFDFSSGRMIKTLGGNKDVVHNLKFSTDGKYLASCAHDGAVLVWKIEDPIDNTKLLYNFRQHSKPVYNIDFNPAKNVLISASYDKTIAVWNLDTGSMVQLAEDIYNDNEAYGVVFSPKGDIVASSGFDGSVKLFDFDKSALILKLPGKTVNHVNLNYTQEIEFTTDGKYLLFGGSYSMKEASRWIYPVFFYQTTTSNIDKIFINHNNTVRSVAVSKNGAWIASTGGNDNETYIYNRNLEVKRKIGSRGKSVFSVAFGNDNGRIYFGTINDGRTYLADGTIDKSFSFIDFVLQKGSDNYYHRIYPLSGKHFFRFEFKLFNRTIYIGSNAVTLPDGYDTIRCYTFTPDGKYAVIGSDFKLVKVDAQSGKILGFFTGHDGPVWNISVSLNGRYLASASDDQTIKIWDMESTALMVTIFISIDGEWVIWTPEGYYNSSKNGGRFLGIVHNQGDDKESIYESADNESFRQKYFNPDKIRDLLAGIFKNKADEITPDKKKEKEITNKREDIIPDNLPDF